MPPQIDDYNDIDEFDDFGFGGIADIRRMINDRQRREQQLGGKRHCGPDGKDSSHCDGCDQYVDYDDIDYEDYDEDEFDRSSGVSLDHHL